MAGEDERARSWFRAATAYANDLGLLAEEADGTTGELLGNTPQAFSHIGLINAAWRIAHPSANTMFGPDTYEGGAEVLAGLRRTVGDDAFFELLRRWVADNNGTSRTTEDFIALAEDVSGRDLGPFFDEWLLVQPPPIDTVPTTVP